MSKSTNRFSAFTAINTNQAGDAHQNHEDSNEDEVDWGYEDIIEREEVRGKEKEWEEVDESGSNNDGDGRTRKNKERGRSRLPFQEIGCPSPRLQHSRHSKRGRPRSLYLGDIGNFSTKDPELAGRGDPRHRIG